jgi:hypothetical protein
MTLNPVVVIVDPIKSTTVWTSISGFPFQFLDMSQNNQCSALFHFEVPD